MSEFGFTGRSYKDFDKGLWIFAKYHFLKKRPSPIKSESDLTLMNEVEMTIDKYAQQNEIEMREELFMSLYIEYIVSQGLNITPRMIRQPFVETIFQSYIYTIGVPMIQIVG